MTYLLDSNSISELYDPEAVRNDCISAHVRSLDESDCLSISILSLYELEYGWANAPEKKKSDIRQVITDIQRDFTVLALSAQGAVGPEIELLCKNDPIWFQVLCCRKLTGVRA